MQLQTFEWGWYIVVYFFVGGIAAGAYFLAALADIFGGPEDRPMAKIGYYIAFPLVLVCAVLLIVDLGHPERFWQMVFSKPWVEALMAGRWNELGQFALNIKTISPMNIGGWALAGFGFFSLLSILDVWVEEGRLTFAPFKAFYSTVPRKLYAAVGVFFGFFLAGYTGVLLNTTAQPGWEETPWIGALFIASAASTGAAAIALILALRNRREEAEAATRLTRMDNLAIIIEVGMLVLMLLSAPLLARVFLGSNNLFAGAFWLFLFTGIIIPLLLQFRSSAGRGHLPRNLAALTAILVLIGGFIMRFMLVMVVQI